MDHLLSVADPDVGCTNANNNESEWYLPSQVSAVDGHLQLKARRQATVGANGAGEQVAFPYRSGMVSSAGKFQFTYGYAEFMARLPAGQALWPATWLLPADHSWPPEIDVMEALGQQPGTIFQTLIPTSGRPAQQQHIVNKPALASGWHAFGVDWEPGGLTWYVDGQVTFATTRSVPTLTMYLLANLAVGGSLPGPVTSATPDDATFDLK